MTIQEAVDALVDKAVQSSDSADALKFSQAALNAAHAYCVWQSMITESATVSSQQDNGTLV